MYCGSLSWAMYRKQLSAQRLQWTQWERSNFILPLFFFSIFLISSVWTGFISCVDILFSILSRLPNSGPTGETIFASDEKAVKEEEKHVSQLCEWHGDEHHFSCEDVQEDHRLIIEPLVISKRACQKRGDRDQKDDVIVNRCDDSNLRYKDSPKKEDGTTDKRDPCQSI